MRSCLVHDGEPYGHIGLYLSNCTQGLLLNNSCSANGVGIELWNSNHITVEGNNCSNNGIGIYLSSSSNNTLEDNLCISNSDGMFLYNACEDDSLIYNTCSWNDGDGTMIELSDRNYASWNDLRGNSQYGVEISSESHSNSISYNVFVGNHGAGTAYEAGHVQAYDSGSGNTWNVTEIFGEFGNYWGDWTTPNTDNDQIVDIPYEVGGSAGAKDNSPLAFDPRVTMPS